MPMASRLALSSATSTTRTPRPPAYGSFISRWSARAGQAGSAVLPLLSWPGHSPRPGPRDTPQPRWGLTPTRSPAPWGFTSRPGSRWSTPRSPRRSRCWRGNREPLMRRRPQAKAHTRRRGSAGWDGLGQPDVFFLVSERMVEAAGGLVGGAGVEGQKGQAAAGGPGLGGVHQPGGDPAPFHPGADGELADVGVYLAGEVGALADGDHAHDGVAVDGEVDGVPWPAERV